MMMGDSEDRAIAVEALKEIRNTASEGRWGRHTGHIFRTATKALEDMGEPKPVAPDKSHKNAVYGKL